MHPENNFKVIVSYHPKDKKNVSFSLLKTLNLCELPKFDPISLQIKKKRKNVLKITPRA